MPGGVVVWLVAAAAVGDIIEAVETEAAARRDIHAACRSGLPTCAGTPVKRRHKNAIFTLVRGGELPSMYRFFHVRAQCLHRAVREPFDHIAFHEGNVPTHIQAWFTREHAIRWVDARDYGGFNESAVRLRSKAHRDYSVGYMNMCRFFSILWIAALRQYEYVMRVDEDVCLHVPEKEEASLPFQTMASARAVYGVSAEVPELHFETVQTMELWLAEYPPWRDRVMPNATVPAQMRPRRVRAHGNVATMYFTNVLVTRVSWWFRPKVQAFLRDVDASGGIYMHRWGDAPIQTVAVRALAPPASVAYIEFEYSHGSTSNEVKGGKMLGGADAEKKKMYEPRAGETLAVDPALESSWAVEHMIALFKERIAPCLVADAFLADHGRLRPRTGLPQDHMDDVRRRSGSTWRAKLQWHINYFQTEADVYTNPSDAKLAIKGHLMYRMHLNEMTTKIMGGWESAQALQRDLMGECHEEDKGRGGVRGPLAPLQHDAPKRCALGPLPNENLGGSYYLMSQMAHLLGVPPSFPLSALFTAVLQHTCVMADDKGLWPFHFHYGATIARAALLYDRFHGSLGALDSRIDGVDRAVMPWAPAPRKVRLFCWVMLINVKPMLELFKEIHPELARCDGHAAYSNESFSVDLGGGGAYRTTRAFRGPMAQKPKQTMFGKIAVNTPVFIKFWRFFIKFSADGASARTAAGTHLDYDWIVKLDVDTVFFADRLRARLEELPPETEKAPVLLTNPCAPNYQQPNGCFFGGLEVFSSALVEEYALKGRTACEPRAEGWDVSEDGYWRECAVQFLGAKELLVGGIISPSVQACERENADSSTAYHAAFHAFKQVGAYRECRRRAVLKPTWYGQSWWHLLFQKYELPPHWPCPECQEWKPEYGPLDSQTFQQEAITSQEVPTSGAS